MQERSLGNDVKSYLNSLYEDVVCPIQRVVLLFQEKLTFLLHAVSIAHERVFPVRISSADLGD